MHNKLLEILQKYYGIGGTILNFFKSYLSNRSTKVLISDLLSDSVFTETGVPQGSILGPILFILYLTPLFHKLKTLNSNFHY